MLGFILLIVVSSIIIGVLTMYLFQEMNLNAPCEEVALDTGKTSTSAMMMGVDDDGKVIVSKAVKEDGTEDDEVYVSPGLQSGEDFGASVLQTTDYCIVGAPGHGRGELDNASGCVYVFRRKSGRLFRTILPPVRKCLARFGTKLSINDYGELLVSDVDDNVFKVNLPTTDAKKRKDKNEQKRQQPSVDVDDDAFMSNN
jgi:biopolymer transport protein ExbD